MARLTRRETLGRRRSEVSEDAIPTPRVVAYAIPSSDAEPSVPPANARARASCAAPRLDREEHERELRLKEGLDWERFEAWCSVNGLPLPAASRDAMAAIGLYVTFLAATGRNLRTIARALLRRRGEDA